MQGVVKVGAVDMDVHGSVGGPYNVRGFPTIKIFGANKNSPQDYNGKICQFGILFYSRYIYKTRSIRQKKKCCIGVTCPTLKKPLP